MSDLVAGVDSHQQILVCAVVDSVGRLVDAATFNNHPNGLEIAYGWVKDRNIKTVGIEGSGSYGRGLAQTLLSADINVVDVPPQMCDRGRRRQKTLSKTDQGDALLIARLVLTENLAPVAAIGLPDELRALTTYRRELVKQLRETGGRVHGELTKTYPGYRTQIKGRVTRTKTINQILELTAHDHSIRTKLIKTRLANMIELNHKIKEIEKQIQNAYNQTGATLTQIQGIATTGAAEILGYITQPKTYPTKAKFAMANGTAPLPASSGKTIRHRLNRGGNRDLNRIIHIAAVTQIRYPQTEGHTYYQTKLNQGKTKKEALRCLKRKISDRIWTHLQHPPQHTNLT